MPPTILISNDDGINAPGLQVLCRALRDLGEIRVAAPDTERSGVSHAVSLRHPIQLRRVRLSDELEGYAVAGTPADCVKLAIGELLPVKPDLVVSGINLGPNAGISVIYSGTVAAATEGALSGIPSIALSLAAFREPCWEAAALVARRIAGETLHRGLPPRTLLNVNIPNLRPDQLAGFAVTSMGRSRFREIIHRRTDPRGAEYFWLDGELEATGNQQAGTDLMALEQRQVSITPIGFDLTDTGALAALRDWEISR